MILSQVAHDLLAVGYSEDSRAPTIYEDGRVMFWSLRRPDFPERIITTPAPVTALAFSKYAVGAEVLIVLSSANDVVCWSLQVSSALDCGWYV